MMEITLKNGHVENYNYMTDQWPDWINVDDVVKVSLSLDDYRYVINWLDIPSMSMDPAQYWGDFAKLVVGNYGLMEKKHPRYNKRNNSIGFQASPTVKG